MSAPNAKMLSLSLKDKPSVYYSYMPFFELGGIFVPTADVFNMGDEVLLLLELLDNPEKFPLKTKVGWITHKRTSNGQPQGIGLMFGDDEISVKCRLYIENQLPGLVNNERATYTM